MTLDVYRGRKTTMQQQQQKKPKKVWPTYLEVPGSSPAWGGGVFNRKWGSIPHSVWLSPANRPDMTWILLKGRKTPSHPSIQLSLKVLILSKPPSRSQVGLGRFIDISVHRNTDCTDARVDTLGAVSWYFLKIEQQILLMLNRNIYFCYMFKVGLGRFIDISMHRNTDCTDTRIDTLSAVPLYFLEIEQQILLLLNLKISHITFNLFTTSN